MTKVRGRRISTDVHEEAGTWSKYVRGATVSRYDGETLRKPKEANRKTPHNANRSVRSSDRKPGSQPSYQEKSTCLFKRSPTRKQGTPRHGGPASYDCESSERKGFPRVLADSLVLAECLRASFALRKTRNKETHVADSPGSLLAADTGFMLSARHSSWEREQQNTTRSSTPS